MHKKILSLILILLPLTALAQNNWEVPDFSSSSSKTEAKAKKLKQGECLITIDGKEYAAKQEDLPYLKGAVPEVDGAVQYDFVFPCPGKSAQQLYDLMLNVMNDLTHEEGQDERSKIALVDKENHSIVAKYYETMTFTEAFLMSDRATFTYTLYADCTDSQVSVSVKRLAYDYNYGKEHAHLSANELITDALMLKNNGSVMKKRNSKFRRKTVDRMAELKEYLQEKIK